MFTKHLEGYDLGQIIESLKSGGVQGADLCVRPDYPVNPENAKTELPAAAKRFADEGLCIPLITTPGDFTDPSMDYAESLFEACAEAGVKLSDEGAGEIERFHEKMVNKFDNVLKAIRMQDRALAERVLDLLSQLAAALRQRHRFE